MKLAKMAAATALALSGTTAFANVLTLQAVNGNLYQQTTQNPCIFSNPSCSAAPAGWTATPLPNQGNVTGYDAYSPVYTGLQVQNVLGAGNQIVVGIDINQANTAQTLTGFEMLKNGNIVDTFSFGGVGNVPAGNNGTGYADYVLSNFSSFLITDTIQFRFVFNNANDGTENVFLVGGVPGGGGGVPVPAPLTLALVGLGMAGVGFARRKKVSG